MEKEGSDILYFVSFCLEQYKMQKGLSGSEALKLFDKNGVTEYLAKHYDVLHTQGAAWLMNDISEQISANERKCGIWVQWLYTRCSQMRYKI